MKNVGILSMQRIINYGSFLQAYGLKMILEELGCNVEFVDYHIEKPIIGSNEKGNKFLNKINKGLEALQYDAPLRHKLQFISYKRNFAKKYHNILGITDEMNYSPRLDATVIGSDEVFNCIQKNPNVGYSLELFGKNNQSKKLISYAASFGNTTLSKLAEHNKKKEIGECLKKFDSISVRDNNSENIVEELTSKKPLCHLDPVLAYDYMGREGLIPEINMNEKYLILYSYSGRISEEEATYISSYAKKRGLKVYTIGGVQKFADKFIDCSPFEVLSYFKNAEAVITDTFHGSIFSIITKKRFVTIVRKSEGDSYGNEEKLTDLLNRLGLIERSTQDVCEIDKILEDTIEYEKVESIIKEERVRTYKYLECALG